VSAYRAIILILVVLTGPAAAVAQVRPPVSVGSKTFTESVILGEIAVRLVRQAGGEPHHRKELGGTRILFNALLNGDIDIYPEYTGTISEEILSGQNLTDEASIRTALARQGVRMSGSLGFNNTYALGMKKARAAQLGIDKISDLVHHPDLKFGFSNEFMDRNDGWPSLRLRYGLPQTHVRGLDHDIAYRGLENEAIDVMDLYATDAEIQYYDLKILTDDRHHFRDYDAVWLYRDDLVDRLPRIVAVMQTLEGKISASEMARLNKRAKLDKVPEGQVAAEFLARELEIESRSEPINVYDSLWNTTRDHLSMVVKSMTAAILLAIPLGIWAAKKRRAAQPILGVVGIIQTIPALALLVIIMSMIKPLKPLGIESLGEHPAVVALFLYSLLPIVRNTYAGLHEIPEHIRESAVALGLPPAVRLWRIELPIASRMILSGIKTAVVINIGFATLGALIGAGGYGQPILTGIRLDDLGLILQGAIPAAVLALVAQFLFELSERVLVPKGLRMTKM